MAQLNFRQLIDLAIGSPEPGHVNFYALHLLLYSFAEKLSLIDEPVENVNYDHVSANSSKSLVHMSRGVEMKSEFMDAQRRFPAGADPAEGEQPVEQTATLVENVEDQAETRQQGSTQLEEASERGERASDIKIGTEVKPATETKPAAESRISESKQKIVPESAQHAAEVKRASEPALVDQKQLTVQQPTGDKTDFYSTENLVNPEVLRGISIMKDQLELAMEELRLLISIVVDKKVHPGLLEQLRTLTQRMQTIQKNNIYIANAYGEVQLFEIRSITDYQELIEGEEEEEEIFEEEEKHSTETESHLEVQQQMQQKQTEQYDLSAHLTYPPEKLLDQLIELKANFCMLTNKVNEISANILDQDSQRTTNLIQDMQEQLRELKRTAFTLREGQERMEAKTHNNNNVIDQMTKMLEELMVEKTDKSEIEILLADKVDYNQLQRKVSMDHVQEMQCRLEKQLCELRKLISVNEKNTVQMMDNVRTSLGLASIDDVLERFKAKIEDDIRALAENLKSYVEATNDECAAAGARMKVLHDLACLSCDTTCVMRTMEKSKVGKFPNAHASPLISPLITYELGSIRKSGTMGYYRKDEFPHAPNAWMQRQNVNIKACVPRHAGGSHTTHTAKEHVEKVLLTKK